MSMKSKTPIIYLLFKYLKKESLPKLSQPCYRTWCKHLLLRNLPLAGISIEYHQPSDQPKMVSAKCLGGDMLSEISFEHHHHDHDEEAVTPLFLRAQKYFVENELISWNRSPSLKKLAFLLPRCCSYLGERWCNIFQQNT